MQKICSFTGINRPRFAVSILAGFVFVFFYEYVVHGILLMDFYNATPDLWRPPAEMEKYMVFMMLCQLFLTSFMAFLFTRNFEGKGIKEGIRFGLMTGAIFFVMNIGSYAWLPISSALATFWGIAGFVEALGLGVVFSLIYRK